MVFCAPTCAIPTCIPSFSFPVCYPVGSLWALSSSGIGCGGSLLGGSGGLEGSVGTISASSLGIAPGASIGCISQTPPSELTVQLAPFVLTVPGPILSASCEPVRVGGYTVCGGGSSSGGNSFLRYSPCKI